MLAKFGETLGETRGKGAGGRGREGGREAGGYLVMNPTAVCGRALYALYPFGTAYSEGA